MLVTLSASETDCRKNDSDEVIEYEDDFEADDGEEEIVLTFYSVSFLKFSYKFF